MNTLSGIITGVESAAGIHLIDVDVAGHPCTATVTGDGTGQRWQRGQPVILAFRELDVSVAKQLSGLISIRNALPCTVCAIDDGEILTRIQLDMGGKYLYAVITRRSSRRLQLEVGDEVDALIKANSMMLLLPETPA